MAFTVNDLRDLTQLLAIRPEWRAEMRRLVLTDELLALPDLVSELAVAQQRTEQQIADLVAAQQRTEQQIANFAVGQQNMHTELAALKGQGLEQRYIQRAPEYFSNFLRRIRVVWPSTLDHTFEDLLEKYLTPDDLKDVLRADVIVKAIARQLASQPEVFLVIEVSIVIDSHDIERAQRRAALLRRVDLRAIPVVAGERLTAGAEELAQREPVVVVQGGRSSGWDRALLTGQISESEN